MQKSIKKQMTFNILGIVIVLAVLIAAFYTHFSNSSLAWFSTNREGTGRGMSLKIDTEGSLVISSSAEDIRSSVYDEINGGEPIFVNTGTNSNTYSPAVHDATSESGLKYVTDNGTIDPSTGVQKEGAMITYASVPSDTSVIDDKNYYVDYTVHVASYGKPITDVALKASIASATKTTSEGAAPIEEGTLMALSVDFYKTSVSNANYLGTLNVAGLDNEENDYPNEYTGAEKTQVYLMGGESETGLVPLNTEGSLTYVLRFYFDGALQSSNGQTYVYAKQIDLSKVNIEIKIIAE